MADNHIFPFVFGNYTSDIKNILLIDDSVQDNDIFFNSVNNTTCAIKYNYFSDAIELENFLT